MKNTIEQKAAFFALYWGQKVSRSPLLSEKLPAGKCTPELALKQENEFYLELKPLSSITDEDATWIADLRYGERLLTMVNHGIEHIAKETIYADYLRKKGYAVDWLDISVEEQEEFGWLKLKEE